MGVPISADAYLDAMSTLKPAAATINGGGGAEKAKVKFEADAESEDMDSDRAETEGGEEDGAELFEEAWEEHYKQARAYLDDCIALLVRSQTAVAQNSLKLARSARTSMVLLADELRGDSTAAVQEKSS